MRLSLTSIAACALLLASGVQAQSATATLIDTDGNNVGRATLKQTPNGVLVEINAKGVPAGDHAFHVHQTGRCDPNDDFASAGGHFALDHQHGFLVEGGPHPGDMPNVQVRDDEVFSTEVLNAHISLRPDGKGYLHDADGSALVIHAAADDYRSQPSGDAGGRIACGVIKGANELHSTDAGKAATGSKATAPRTDSSATE